VRRILVVGDSVGQTLGRGLERWGPEHGVTVVNAARFYCGIPRGGRLGMALGRTADACADWGDRWPRLLDRVQPDVVVMLSTLWDVTSRQRDEWGPEYLKEGDPRFDSFVTDEYRAAADLLASRGARVIWLTSPCSINEGVTTNLYYGNAHFLGALIRTRPVTKIDLAAKVCADGRFSNQIGDVAEGRPDGMHFSDPGADWVASWLGPRLADPNVASDLAPAERVRRF
jgi:lysophospholipase L1-like esterase